MDSWRIKFLGALFILLGTPLVSSLQPEAVEQGVAFRFSSATRTPTGIPATPIPIEIRLERLQSSVEAFDNLVEIQANSFDSTVTRLESNLNLLLAFVAIISVIVGIIGLGFVRVWIRRSVEQQLSGTAQAEIEKALTEELAEFRNVWDPKFNALYEEYRNLVKRDSE